MAFRKRHLPKWPPCSEGISNLHRLIGECSNEKWFGSALGPSRVSAVAMRELRIRFLGEILRFKEEHSHLNAAWITASQANWRFGWDDKYWDESEFPVLRIFDTILRVTGIMTAPGYLIAYLHAYYDLGMNSFQLQFRGICAGEKLSRFQEIPSAIVHPGRPLIAADCGTEVSGVSEIVTGAHNINTPEREILWLMPQTATMGSADYPVNVLQRAPEPHHCLYLRWAYLYRFQPVVVLSGVRLRAVKTSGSTFRKRDSGRLSLMEEAM